MGGFFDNALSEIGNWRYGMSTDEKARRVQEGLVPGQPEIDWSKPDTAEKADKYGAGYYFGREHPGPIGDAAQTIGNMFDTFSTKIPYGPGGIKTPELNPFVNTYSKDLENEQSYTTAGRNRALLDIANEDRAEKLRGQPEEGGFFRKLITGGYR